MAKIVIATKYFKAICANLELLFYVNDTSILYLLTDVRRKGSNKHEVWQMSGWKKFKKKMEWLYMAMEGREQKVRSSWRMYRKISSINKVQVCSFLLSKTFWYSFFYIILSSLLFFFKNSIFVLFDLRGPYCLWINFI